MQKLSSLILALSCFTFSNSAFCQNNVVFDSGVNFVKFNRPLPEHQDINPSQIQFIRLDSRFSWGCYRMNVLDGKGRVVYLQDALPLQESVRFYSNCTSPEVIAKIMARLSSIESKGKRVHLNFDYLDSISKQSALEVEKKRAPLRGKKIRETDEFGSSLVDASTTVADVISAMDLEKFFEFSDRDLDLLPSETADFTNLRRRVEKLEERLNNLEK